MAKINSDYIKNNVSCAHCESTKLKRSYKKSFKSPIDEVGNKKNTTMEWRQFTCSSCGEITNVLNTEEHIISTTEHAILPFCAFNVELSIQDSELCSLSAFFSYKETQGEVIEDDLRDEHILNMQNYFNKFNIYVENLAENLFKIYFNKDKHSFLSNSSVLNYLKKILSDAGCNVSIGEESSFILDIYLSDEEYNSFVREYKTLTTSYSYNGVDSLNQFPDATIEDFRKIPMFKDAVFVYNDDDDDDEVQTLFSYSSKCECINCKSTNLICKVEKEFKNTVDENGLLYKGKIQFKEMECSDCKESFHFLMKGGQIIMSSYIPVVPLSEYRFHILFEPESCGAFMMMFLKDEYNHAQEDNIRTENVLGLEEYFKHFHIGVHNEMENTWSFDFDPKKTDFEYDKKFVKFLTKKMKEAGATFDKTLDPDFEG